MTRLSLAEARKTGRLREFVAQEEARGVGPVDEAELEATIEAMAKPPQSADRTSRSASRGGSRGS